MPVELLCCRCCGSDNLEVIEPGGQVVKFDCASLEEMVAAAKLFGAIGCYPGKAVGQQFHCHECGRLSDQCAVKETAGAFSKEDIPLAQRLVADMRRRRAAAAEEWGGLAY